MKSGQQLDYESVCGYFVKVLNYELIDSDSTKSSINPKVTSKFYRNNLKVDPFQIITAHSSSVEQYNSATVVAVQEFLVFQMIV